MRLGAVTLGLTRSGGEAGLRWIFRVLSAVAVLVGLVFLTLALIPSDRIVAVASSEFTRVTGRKLLVEGTVNPSVWPVIGVETGRITLSNADWSDAGPMLRAEGMAIGVDLASLLQGSLRITRLELQRPEILLERAEDGVGNWTFATGAAGAGTGGSFAATPVTLASGIIRDGRITYIDHASDRRVEIDGVEAEASLADGAGSLTLDLTALAGGREIAVSATAADVRALARGEAVSATLSATAGDAQLGFEGLASVAPLAAEGTLDADLADLSDIAALFAQSPPSLPAGWGADRVALSGAVTLTAQQSLHLRGGVVTLDRREIRGDADLFLAGSRPRLVAQVATGPTVLGGASGVDGEGAAAQGWPEEPIDASALRHMDADIGFRTDALQLGPLKLGAVNGQIVIDRARAELTLAEVAAYGGAMSGTLVANAREGLSMSADLAFRGVALQPLLTDVAGISRLVGTGDMAVQVIGTGGSVAAILNRLSGSASIALGGGRIEGVDLSAILATLDPARAAAGGETAFDRLTASFLIEQGQMTNEDFLMDGRLVTATGQGRIGIGTRDLDFHLRPVALTGADGTGGLGVPVRISGPWAAPSVTLDLEALAQERYGEQLKAAEDDARARAAALEEEAKRKLQEELGAAPDEDLRDAAKRKLDEELQRQIGNTLNELLGGN